MVTLADAVTRCVSAASPAGGVPEEAAGADADADADTDPAAAVAVVAGGVDLSGCAASNTRTSAGTWQGLRGNVHSERSK